MLLEMDNGRIRQNGRLHSKIAPAPPPKPKPIYAKPADRRNSGRRSGSVPIALPLPPPPIATTSSSTGRLNEASRHSPGTSDITSARRNRVVSNSREHSQNFLADGKEEFIDDLLGSEDEVEDLERTYVKPNSIGNGIRKSSRSSSKESGNTYGHCNEKVDEMVQVNDKDEDDEDEDEDRDCCLSPKDLLMQKVKPFCTKIRPCCQTLFSNLVGVLIGAIVTYATLRMGLSPSSLLPTSTTSYRPIESFWASPISGIRSEIPQPWITIDLSPLIAGVKQLDAADSAGASEALGLDSLSIVLNITHKQFGSEDSTLIGNSTSAALNESVKVTNATPRTHLVRFSVKRTDSETINPSFRVKRQVRAFNPSSEDEFGGDGSETTGSPEEESIFVLHEQIGHEDLFEAFIPLVEDVQEKLTHLLLRYITISPQQLLESLKYAKRLRVLELDQVKLLGYFDGRTQLPALSRFSLHVVNSSNLVSTTAPIKTYLFFDKDGYWRIEKIASLGVDIDLTFDGRKYVGINHSKGQLVSQLLMTNTILVHLYLYDRVFQLLDLALSFVELNIDLVPASLEHLSLSSVTFQGGQSLQKLLQKLVHLKSLELNNVTSSSDLNVSDLPSSLKHLAYGRSSLHYAPDVLLNLDSLYLDALEGEEQLFYRFNFVFNASRIAVSGLPSPIQPHTFLKRVLQMGAVQWIYMENFDRTDVTTQNKTAHPDFTEIEWFLISAGVPSAVEVFLLEKNVTTGTWSGNGVTIEQHKHLWFDLFGMEKFWTRASVDVLNGMKGQKYITYYLNKHDESDDELTTMAQ